MVHLLSGKKQPHSSGIIIIIISDLLVSAVNG